MIITPARPQSYRAGLGQGRQRTAERQSIQTCTNVGCFVAMTLTDKLIAAMRAGSDLKITVQDANKKPIEMSLPLLGFGIAFDKAK
jgi:invasion protein IalB